MGDLSGCWRASCPRCGFYDLDETDVAEHAAGYPIHVVCGHRVRITVAC